MSTSNEGVNEFYQCDRKQLKDLFNDKYPIFDVLWRFHGRCQVDHSVQTEQDQRQLEIERMFVNAEKEGHGINSELNLLF